jgi:hypothetical protein
MKDIWIIGKMLSEKEKAAEAANASSSATSSIPTESLPPTAVPVSGSSSPIASSSDDDPARPTSLYAMLSPLSSTPTRRTSALAVAALLSGPAQKVTLEQREKLVAHDREIERTDEARVQMLTENLVERLRPFVEAKNPGAPGDAETVAWEARMRHEAEDVKVESFGVEILHAIGAVYATKANGFLQSKRFWGL